MALFPFDTVATIVSDAAVELGLVAADVADPYGSPDQNILLLCRLLKSLGRDLLREYDWGHLRLTYSIPTVNGTQSYAGPADFVSFVDGTAWNPVQHRRVLTATPQQWETLVSSGITNSVEQFIRVAGGATNSFFFEVFPTPSAAENITFEYMSNLWVRAAADGDGDDNSKSVPTLASDILCLDALLLMRGLKVAFLRAKGMDSTAAQQDYEYTLQLAKDADGEAPTLGLPGHGIARLLDPRLPVTGWGT